MPRRAIVIGGGGVLGGTWAVGALSALEVELGISARECELLVGTSAGSVLAALIASGVTTGELRQEYGDEKVTSGPLAGYEWNPVRATICAVSEVATATVVAPAPPATIAPAVN